MTPKAKPDFNPKLFLAKVGKGRIIAEYSKDQMVFSQGDPADAVFYIQKGKIKLTSSRSSPTTAKKQSSPSSVLATSWANDAWWPSRYAWQPPPQYQTARSYDSRKRL
jgi:hypothetical protein